MHHYILETPEQYFQRGGRITVCPPAAASNDDWVPATLTELGAAQAAKKIKRHERTYTLDGKQLTLSQWSRVLHIPYPTLQGRLQRRWSLQRMLTEPVSHVGRHKNAHSHSQE